MRYCPGDPAFAQLERVVAGGAPAEDRTSAHFVLGKAYADIGDWRRSFESYRAANAFRRQAAGAAAKAYDAAWNRRVLDFSRTVLTRDHFASRAGLGLDDPRPVFIVGFPRSGKTLIEQILSSHPSVSPGGETLALEALAREVAKESGSGAPYPECLPAVSPDSLAMLAQRLLATLAGGGRSGERIIDTSPDNAWHLGLLALLCPRARVIHCRRDARDLVLACHFKFFEAGHAYATDLGQCARFLRLYESMMEHWRAVLPLEFVEVRYEDLVTDPRASARRIIGFLDLPWSETCLPDAAPDAKELGAADSLPVRSRLSADFVGFSRHYEAFLGPLDDALARPAQNLRG